MASREDFLLWKGKQNRFTNGELNRKPQGNEYQFSHSLEMSFSGNLYIERESAIIMTLHEKKSTNYQEIQKLGIAILEILNHIPTLNEFGYCQSTQIHFSKFKENSNKWKITSREDFLLWKSKQNLFTSGELNRRI